MKTEVPYELLSKYFTGECSAEESAALETWKNESEANKKVFLEMEKAWDNASTGIDFNPDIEEGLKEVNAKIGSRANNQKSRLNKNTMFYITRIAAMLILVAGLWFSYNYFIHPEDKQLTISTQNDIEEIRLPDGSVVTLNAHSSIKYPKNFSTISRVIEFKGEGYFEIAKDSGKPFIIKTGETKTRVLGTKFNLRALDNEDEVIISVTEGKVEFSAQALHKESKKVILMAGDNGILKKDNKKLIKEKNTDLNILSWKTKQLIFKDTPLITAIKDLEKYYNTSIVLKNNELDSVGINYTLSNNTLHEALEIIKLLTGTEIDKFENQYIIK